MGVFLTQSAGWEIDYSALVCFVKSNTNKVYARIRKFESLVIVYIGRIEQKLGILIYTVKNAHSTCFGMSLANVEISTIILCRGTHKELQCNVE